jgi:hypothetical protein
MVIASKIFKNKIASDDFWGTESRDKHFIERFKKKKLPFESAFRNVHNCVRILFY